MISITFISSLRRAYWQTLLLFAAVSSSILSSPAQNASVLPGKPQVAFDAGLEAAAVHSYKTIKEGDLKLYVLAPPKHQPADSSAAILFFFGGSWRRGQPSQFARQASYFASRGMVAICVDYRVRERQGTTPFECVADGKAAMRWVRAHAKELGIDPSRIAAAGGSAGGHVAVSTAVLTEVEEAGANTSLSCVPDALVLFNPVIDTSPEGFGSKNLGQRWRELSPLHHVRTGLPPTIIFHGKNDKTVPFLGVKRFSEAMTKSGNVCKLMAFERQGHGFYVRKEPWYSQVVRDTDIFLSGLGWISGPPTLQEAEPAPNSNLEKTEDSETEHASPGAN